MILQREQPTTRCHCILRHELSGLLPTTNPEAENTSSLPTLTYPRTSPASPFLPPLSAANVNFQNNVHLSSPNLVYKKVTCLSSLFSSAAGGSHFRPRSWYFLASICLNIPFMEKFWPQIYLLNIGQPEVLKHIFYCSLSNLMKQGG